MPRANDNVHLHAVADTTFAPASIHFVSFFTLSLLNLSFASQPDAIAELITEFIMDAEGASNAEKSNIIAQVFKLAQAANDSCASKVTSQSPSGSNGPRASPPSSGCHFKSTATLPFHRDSWHFLDDKTLRKAALRVTQAVWELLPAVAMHCPDGVEETALDVAFWALTQESPCMVAADDFDDFIQFFAQRVWNNKHTPGSQWIRQAFLSTCQQEFRRYVLHLYGISDPNKATDTSSANEEKIKTLREGDKWAKGDTEIFGANDGLLTAVDMVLRTTRPQGNCVSYSVDTLAYFLASAQNILSPQPCMPPVGHKLTEAIRVQQQKIDVAQLTAAGLPEFSDEKVSTKVDSMPQLHADQSPPIHS